MSVTTDFTIRTDPHKVSKLDAIAADMSRSRNFLMNEALDLYLDFQEKRMQEIEVAMASLKQGKGLRHDQAMTYLKDSIQARYRSKKSVR